MTKVINIHSDDLYDVYIGRAGKGMDGYFGNPYTPRTAAERGSAITQYKRWFWARVNNDEEFHDRVVTLQGKVLGCFCHPKPCHGDVIVAWLEAGCPLKETP